MAEWGGRAVTQAIAVSLRVAFRMFSFVSSLTLAAMFNLMQPLAGTSFLRRAWHLRGFPRAHDDPRTVDGKGPLLGPY